MNISKKHSDAINIGYVSAIPVARLSFVLEQCADKNVSPDQLHTRVRVSVCTKPGEKEREGRRADRRAFVYSKSMEFVAVKILWSSERAVIDWKFCSKRIKFLSTRNTFPTFQSRVHACNDIVSQQRQKWDCSGSLVASSLFTFLFFPSPSRIQSNRAE